MHMPIPRVLGPPYCVVVSLLISGLAMACTGAAPQHALQTVRDSAGITIVEDRDTNWATTTAWHVDTTPMVSIGVVEGPAEYRFSGISGVVGLPKGEIAVADNGSGQVRFYDANGRFVKAIGRRGEGPGEFRFMSYLHRYPGDSLIVWDFPQRRFTILSDDGALGRVVPGPDLPGFYFMVNVEPFADGALLGSITAPSFDLGSAAPGFHRDTTFYFRYDPGTQTLDTVAALPGSAEYVGTRDGRKAVMTPWFNAEPVVAVDGARMFFGPATAFEVRSYSETGALTRVLRLDRPDAPVTGELIAAALQRRLANARNDNARRQIEAHKNDVPYPKTLPAYGALMVDADTDLWVAQYPTHGEGLSTWTVFDPTGHLLGEVATPPRLDVYDIGSDYVLGVRQDSLDVEHVVMYALEK